MDSGLERLITLTRQMQDGDMSGFDEFYERTKKFIYFSIVKIVDDFTTGEDLLQETYVYFLEHLSHLKTDQSPIGFLLITGKHLAIDYLRKRRREVDLEEIPSSFYSLDEKPIELLQEVPRLLSKEEAAIVLLHVQDDLTFREIASYLGKPLGTIQWKYNGAMKKLRKEITPDAYR
ncbi:MAG: ECF RNA polymerase sigma factor SigK [Tenericutes bacterium ADurb.BinA155]|nr:MAG: ECF RNA polymerase sigma factor SigK [Tenericutes bacterium ADurb.BinA155]